MFCLVSDELPHALARSKCWDLDLNPNLALRSLAFRAAKAISKALSQKGRLGETRGSMVSFSLRCSVGT